MTPPRKAEFAATRWSLVLSAHAGEPEAAERALEELCRTYWYPLYAFVRRQGRDADEADDLTQSFFARLIEKRWLAAATPEKGRFRTFLLTALSHFLANEWVREHRLKRGGGHRFVALDAATAEERYLLEPAETATPEVLFERRWALTVLENAFAALEAESRATGRHELFHALRPHLSGDPDAATFAATAPGLGLSEGALKVAAHRLRRRYGELVRAEIGRTVDDDPATVDLELRHLREVLRG
jgi:RNA polymerase sigma-70 factor (ECF subfamily)